MRVEGPYAVEKIEFNFKKAMAGKIGDSTEVRSEGESRVKG